MTVTVYIATNRHNGKRYVGLTGESLHARRMRHIRHARSGRKTRFAAAIRKYGQEAFDWAELCVTATLDEAKAKEIELIACLQPEYNVTAGGDGTMGVPALNRQAVLCLNDGMVFSSQAQACRHYSLCTGDVSLSCDNKRVAKGQHFIRYDGQLLTEIERKDLILRRIKARAVSRRRSGRQELPELKAPTRSNARAVVCLDDGKQYGSASAAAAAYGLARSGVIEVCNGKGIRKKHIGGMQQRFTAGGLRFSYAQGGAP